MPYLKKSLSAYSSAFWSCLYYQAKKISRKGLMEGPPKNNPDLEYPCPNCLLTKVTTITRVLNIEVSNPPPGFILYMDFAFFNLEIIHIFTSNFVYICSDTSHRFGFTSRRKHPSHEILKFIVTTSTNQDKQVAFIQVDEYGTLARSSEFNKTCHNMNIIIQTTSGSTFLLDGKI